MVREKVRDVELSKALALEHFRRAANFDRHILDSWTQNSPRSLDVSIQLVRSFVQDGSLPSWENLIQSAVWLQKERGHFATLAGIVFEYMALSDLAGRLVKAPSYRVMEMGSKYGDIVSLLEAHGIVHVDYTERGIFFQGITPRVGKSDYLVIPDGLVIRQDDNNSRSVVGFVECNSRKFSKRILGTRRFVNLLMQDSLAFRLFAEVMLEKEWESLSLNNKNLILVQLVRKDMTGKEINKAEIRGWITMPTAFDYDDVKLETVRLLESHLRY